MRQNYFKATFLAITFLICFSNLGVVWGTEHSESAEVNASSDYEWNLVIDGMVDQPLNLSLSQIAAMPETKVNADLYCFSTLLASGNWIGVKLSVLLENAGLRDGAKYIQFVALDGYAAFLDRQTALREDVIVAYKLNGESFPEILRLVLPNENGDKWIALITRITAVTVPISAPGQPNSMPTIFREGASSLSQPGNGSAQTTNETTIPPEDPPTQSSDNQITQFQDVLRENIPKTIDPEPTESTIPEPATQEPIDPEIAEPTEAPLGTTEIAIIVTVGVALVIAAVSFWVLKN